MGLATLPAWVRAMEELTRLDEEGKARQYNTAWIRQRIGEQELLNFGGCQIPVFLCLVKSLDLECSSPPCKLVDQQGQVSGILHKDVLENYGDVVQANSVLLLRKVKVMVTARKQYVSITCDNLVAVYKDSKVTQVVELSSRDLCQGLPIRKRRLDNSDQQPPSAPSSMSSSSSRIPSTYEGRRGSVFGVTAGNSNKPISSTTNLANSPNNSLRMPPPSQLTQRQQNQTPTGLGQTSFGSSQATIRHQGQSAVKSNMATTPMINSNRTPSITQLPLSFPTPPVTNFGHRHGPVGASHPQRLNTQAHSQVSKANFVVKLSLSFISYSIFYKFFASASLGLVVASRRLSGLLTGWPR